MSKNKKLVWLFCFIIIDIFLIVGFLVVRDATEANKLKKEVKSLSSLNITKDNYDTKIKCNGKFAVVEKAIKTYLNNYATNIQKVTSITSDSQFTGLLSVDNYSNDGPAFANSIMYITNSKKDFNDSIDSLIKDSEEDNIKAYITKYMNDSYYVALYNQLMFGDDMSKDFKNTKDLLNKTKDKVNLIFDTSLKVYEFLSINKGNWEVQDGEIKFKTNDLINQYNTFISNIK